MFEYGRTKSLHLPLKPAALLLPLQAVFEYGSPEAVSPGDEVSMHKTVANVEYQVWKGATQGPGGRDLRGSSSRGESGGSHFDLAMREGLDGQQQQRCKRREGNGQTDAALCFTLQLWTVKWPPTYLDAA